MDADIAVNSMYANTAAKPPYDEPGTDKQFEANTKEVPPAMEGSPDYDMQKEDQPESDEKMQDPPPIQKGPLFSVSYITNLAI